MNEENIEKLRIKAHDNSFHSFGKAFIFEKRSVRYTRLINLLTILGIVVPVLIGSLVLAYGLNSNLVQIVIRVAIPITIFQLILSVISVVYRWSYELSYSIESAQEHHNLHECFKKLAEFPNNDFGKFQQNFDLINTKLIERTKQDTKHSFKERELRMGMRYALREYQKECVGCGQVPVSMESTDCHICGNFENKFLKI